MCTCQNLARFGSNELVHQGLDRKVKYNLLGDLETIIRLQATCVVNIMACVAIAISLERQNGYRAWHAAAAVKVHGHNNTRCVDVTEENRRDDGKSGRTQRTDCAKRVSAGWALDSTLYGYPAS